MAGGRRRHRSLLGAGGTRARQGQGSARPPQNGPPGDSLFSAVSRHAITLPDCLLRILSYRGAKNIDTGEKR
jgi:hypothetical protein